MIRVSMIFLVLLLFGAAAGRYRAEVSVREARTEIGAMEAAKQSELREIQMLRAEIAYLENPDRLSKIADIATDLEPLSSRQLLTADDFVLAFARRPVPAADASREPKGGRPGRGAGKVAVADLGPAQ